MITKDQLVAAAQAAEAETIKRCADIIRQYANSKNDATGKPASRMAAVKQMAAREIVSKIEALRKGR